MKYLITLFLSVFFFAATAQKQLVVDGNARIRPLSGSFTGIKVSDGIDLYLSQSDDYSLALSSTNERDMESIRTEIKDGILHIDFEGDKGLKFRNRQLRAYVSFKDLNMLSASGASDVIIAGTLTGTNFRLVVSGASDFKGNVSFKDMTLDLSGASDVIISGTVDNLNISTSGASDVKGFDLVVKNCVADASGASDINISVSEELSANASGASHITYRGTGKLIKTNTSGASVVKKGK